MKSVTNDYKDQLKAIGREYQASITYTIENTNYMLGNDDLNAVTPHYESDIMKSVMKQLDLDSNVDIPVGTEINCQFGLLVGNSYEMLDYGNYIVYSSEKQEDVNSYRIICYDKMLNAEKDYEALPITYPITVKNYLTAIATKLGLTLATQEFVNDDVLIANEKYLTSDGEPLGYTFRDVLDELAQVTASFICINNNDELEVRYIQDTNNSADQTRNSNNLRTAKESLLPEGYTQVEYIKTPSNSFGPYIKITPSIGTKATLEFEFKVGTNGAGYLYGFNSSNNYDYKHTYSYISNDLYVISVNRYENDSWTIEKNKKYKMKITRASNTSTTYEMTDEDSTTIHSGSAGQGYSIREVPFPIFATEYYVNNVLDNTEYSKDIYLYRFKVYSGWGGTTLDNDLVPCTRDSDNKPGLYDIVNNVFYVNVGTGEFELPTPAPTEVVTINEEYLNDTKVAFKKKFGPVNSVVLSRSLNSDNIYRKDDQSIAENGLCEINISENQILSSDDRGNFIDGIYNELKDLEFYENDYESKGITYLELGDKYQVQIGEETYPCVMLNDELNISSGFGELVHTDSPATSETDYNTSSKSDRETQRTDFIVDKQNGVIQTLVNKVVDISIDGATTTNELVLNGIAESEPFDLIVKPLSTSISNNYPLSTNYPSSTNYLKTHLVRFHNNTTNENIDYYLPADLLYYDENNYDTFEFDYTNQICHIIKKCDYNSQGVVQPVTEYIVDYELPKILLTRGDYTISVINNDNNIYIYCKLLLLNDYTDQMATEVEVESQIKQTSDEIMLQVNQKVNTDDIVASLNVAVEEGQGIVELKGNAVTIDSDNFKLDERGNLTCNNADAYNLNIRSGTIELFNTPEGLASFKVGEAGWFGDNSVHIYDEAISLFAKSGEIIGAGVVAPVVFNAWVEKYDNYYSGNIVLGYARNINNVITDHNFASIELRGRTGEIECVSLTQTSLEKNKKNYEKLKSGLDIVKDTEIYKYNLVTDEEGSKKHIGFIIGDNYKYREEITSSRNDGVELYSMCSVLWKAVQEQQEIIEKLEKEIKEMK